MRSRFNPKAAALMALTPLLHVACSSSAGDDGQGSGGSRAGFGGVASGAAAANAGSGGSLGGGGGELGSGGSIANAGGGRLGVGGQLGSGGSTAGAGGGQLGSGGSIVSAGGAAPSSSGAPASAGQYGGAPANAGGRVGGGGSAPITGGSPSTSGGGVGAAGAGGCDEANGHHLSADGQTCTNTPRMLCIFDYDLVLSSHSCSQTTSNRTKYLCRTNACTTYAWHDQCLALAAREAIAECVRHGAYIGIASHSQFDACWNDKVIETLTPAAFPEFFSSIHYDKTGTDFSYPAIDDRANWNCSNCAYHFDGMVKGSKPALIRKVMAHYGLSPDSKADQSRVVYWEDDPAFIEDVRSTFPNAKVIAVTSTNPASDGAGCGIQPANVTAGWAALAASAP